MNGNYILKEGDFIYVQEQLQGNFDSLDVKKKPRMFSEKDFEKTKEMILEESTDFLIVNKPNGFVSQGASKAEEYKSVPLLLRNYFQKMGDANKKPFIVHRLDKPASGLMIVPTNPRFAKEMTKRVRDRRFYKSYTVVSSGLPLNFFNQENGFKDKVLRKYLMVYLERFGYSKVDRKGQTYSKIRKIYKDEGPKVFGKINSIFRQTHAKSFEEYVNLLTDFLIPENFGTLMNLLGLESSVSTQIVKEKQAMKVSEYEFVEKGDEKKDSAITDFRITKIFKVNTESLKTDTFSISENTKSFLQNEKFSDFYKVKDFFKSFCRFVNDKKGVFFVESEVSIKGGKKHQIRVVSAQVLGSPVLLDHVYQTDSSKKGLQVLQDKSALLRVLSKVSQKVFLHCGKMQVFLSSEEQDKEFTIGVPSHFDEFYGLFEEN